LPVDPSLQPVLRSFQRLRRALEDDPRGPVDFYANQLVRELGDVQGPSEYLMMARNQLLRMAPHDLDVQRLDALESLVFGRLVDSDEPAPQHPLEGSLQWALVQLGPFVTSELSRSDKLIREFLHRESALLTALYVLQDALVLPPAALSELTSSAFPEVREWAQAVIDAATT
jgi:hypothetical protein